MEILKSGKMNRRGFLRRSGAAAAALGLGATPLFAQSRELRFAHIFNETQPFHKWAIWAGEQIGEKTGGRFNIRVYPSSSLGSEVDILQSLALGTIDMGFTGSGSASRSYGPMAIIGAPMMFRDFDHWTVYRDSDVNRQVIQTYNEKSGLHVLASVYYGQRQTTANKLIETPADMAGMKLRVPNVPLYLIFPRATGANPSPIAFSEVYLALQQGTVDGQENPLPTIYAQKFHEVQSHVALTNHMIDTLVAQSSGALWNGLSEEEQQIFDSTFEEAMAHCAQDVRQEEEQLVQTLREAGVTVNETDGEAFRAAIRPYLTGDDVPWSAAEYEQVQALAG